ncbi:MAG: diacylglycerol kinase [Candidatus Kerfeldbacteria bacterium]|nr:diacylglycerol kinase [Candidatus Kerfeldbacteria bacterium]
MTPRWVKSFYYAGSGLHRAFLSERHVKVHLVFGLLAAVLAVILDLSRTEWILLLLTITMVLTLELVNSVLEDLVDLLEPRIHDRVKIIKDGAAAAVLLAAIAAAVIGILLFLPHVRDILW